MSAGLELTFELLAATGNEAAVDLLLPALDSVHRAIQENALRAIIDRRSVNGQRELVKRWHTFDERLRLIVAERPGRIHDALRDAVLGTDAAICGNACDALLWVKEYDLLPSLITAAEDRHNPLGDETARTLLALAELLYEELAAPRDYRNRRDPQQIRQHLLGSLEASLNRYEHHKRGEILDAFLLLTNRDNAALKRVLLNPHERVYLPLIEVLSHSTRPGVMRLLLAFLDDPHAPHAALTVLARRTDETFLRHLLKKLAADQSQQVRANLKRIESIPWLREDLRRLATLSEEEQSGVVFLAMAAGIKRPHAFEVVQFLLRHGNVGGRRAASRELNEFRDSEANQAVLAAIDDSDPEVQVNLLLQLRERGIPGAVTKLLELVDSPHANVRHAVQQCLAEFSFKRYLAAFDQLPPDAKVHTGALVRKIDPTAIAQLCEELAASVRARKLRAVEIVSCMGVALQVEPSLIDLLADEEPFLRLEAAQLLANCDTPLTRQALRTALLDRHAGVQAAAEKSLRVITKQNEVSGSPSILGSVP